MLARLEVIKLLSWLVVAVRVCLYCINVLIILHLLRGSVDGLFPLFLANLEDSIPSVRQGAAVALAELLTAYGEWWNYCVCVGGGGV